MKKAFLMSLLLLACMAVFAAWSTDPMAPSLIAGFTGEQVIPKAAVTPSGNTYICRFDNSSGGYKVWLNYLDYAGDPIWTNPEGLLVSDNPSMTWLTDYDMTIDNDGNAVIVFQDIRNVGVNNVFAYKISPQGTFLWGEDGVAMSADTNTEFSNMAPVVFNSTDNSTYVAWQRMTSVTTIVMNRLSSTGQKLWGDVGVTIAAMEGSYTWPQMIQSTDNDFLLKYYHDTGPFWAPNRHIYVARYIPEGTRLWNTVASDAGGLAAWQQEIPFVSDGAGGGILAWYEDRENDMDQDVYTQRVTGAGTISMPEDGALISQDTSNQQYYPKLAIDTVNQQIYAFFRCTDANQNLYGLGRQMLSFIGERLWGDTAPMEIAISSTNVNVAAAYYSPSGAICYYEYGDAVYAGCWRASGSMGWTAGVTAVSTMTGSRDDFDASSHSDGWSVISWSQGMSNMDIYAMRVNVDGLLGASYPAPRDLTATLVPPDDVMLTWVAPSQYLIPEGYYIYLDTELAQVVTGDVTSYQLENLAPGEHNVYLRARYAGDHYSAYTVTITVMIVSNSDPLNVPGISNLQLYPNPCNDRLQATFYTDTAGSNFRASIYNLRGQSVWSLAGISTSGVNSLDLHAALAHLSDSGIYFLRLETEGCTQTSKILRVE